VAQPAWSTAQETLFEWSMAVIRQFAAEHPAELCSALAFTVDSDYAGVALNIDTLENSLAEAQRQERYLIEYRNRMFAREDGWRDARYFVAHHTNRVDDCNLRGSYKYELVAFVKLAAWEEYFYSIEDCPELEGRVIQAIWRVVERLVSSGAFESMRLSTCFRVAFGFHDDELIVLRILNWPAIKVEQVVSP
jgi:hypothetical protein